MEKKARKSTSKKRAGGGGSALDVEKMKVLDSEASLNQAIQIRMSQDCRDKASQNIKYLKKENRELLKEYREEKCMGKQQAKETLVSYKKQKTNNICDADEKESETSDDDSVIGHCWNEPDSQESLLKTILENEGEIEMHQKEFEYHSKEINELIGKKAT